MSRHPSSPETRAKISASLKRIVGHKGSTRPGAVKEQIAKSMAGNQNRLGSRHSPKTKAKMAEAMRVRQAARTPEQRREVARRGALARWGS